MKFRNLLIKGITLKKQRAGQPEAGPLGPFMQRFSDLQTTGIQPGPASPVGMDLVRITAKLDLWVLFVNTDGRGIAPWRRLIILDADYRGEGQVEYPTRAGMVAHELTHLLQREIKQSYYWPSGSLNPVRGRRWIGDSTNYMELLAYIVGSTVEYDLTLVEQSSPGISPEKDALAEKSLAALRGHLSLLTGAERGEISQVICNLFPENRIYEQNQETERRYPDHRIPPGTWHSWLRHLGFSRASVDYIMILAARGKNEKHASLVK